jgi:hypothetical protein
MVQLKNISESQDIKCRITELLVNNKEESAWKELLAFLR